MSYDRRGFFSKLGSMFGGRNGDQIFFFGIQVVANIYGEDEARQALHRVIADGGTEESPAQKRSSFKRVTSLLLENQPFFEYGYWDLLTDSDEAQAEFESWVNEIEGSMATEEEEFGETTDEVHRLSSEKSYIIVTMAFVLENVPAHEPILELVDSIAEDQYFDPSTFTKLIESVSYIDFEYSLGDAMFIMPGNDRDGISFEDLHGEGWEYLKPIMGSL